MRGEAFLTHNDSKLFPSTATHGSSFKAKFSASKEKLIELFGEPMDCDDGKSTAEWHIEVKAPEDSLDSCFGESYKGRNEHYINVKPFSRYCTIYDWKEEYGEYWHIGAHDLGDALLLSDIVARGLRGREATHPHRPPTGPNGKEVRNWRTVCEHSRKEVIE